MQMNYKLKIKNMGDYLLFTTTGMRSMESVISIAKDVQAACAKEKVNKALVDVRAMVGELSTIDAYDLSEIHFPIIQDRKILKLVVIVDNKENEARYHFLETVAVNRGFPIQYCNNIKEGTELLK